MATHGHDKGGSAILNYLSVQCAIWCYKEQNLVGAQIQNNHMRKIEKALQPWLQDRILSSADGQLPSVQALGLGQLRVVREALRAAGRNSRVLNRNRIYKRSFVL